MAIIKFGEWLPDLPSLENPGALIAKNVIPRSTSYGPLSNITAYTDAITARCQGAISVRDFTGNVNWFAGDAAKLYRLNSGTAWSDVSKAAGYNTQDIERWRFAQFGERIIATNYNDNVQSFVLGVSTDFDDLYADFKAKYCAVVRDFVVYAYTNDTVNGEQPQRVRWSAINDPTSITVSATTQSDFQDVVGDGREIMGIVTGVAGADAIIVQRNALVKMNYVGAPLIFRFDKVEGSKGCIAPGSICQYGGVFFYLAEDGWYMSDGLTSVPIGSEKINKWFLADFAQTFTDRISSMVDPINQVMICAYPDGNSAGLNTKLLLYNFVTKRFSYGVLTTEFIFPTYTIGLSIDDISGSIDDVPFSLDSAVYLGDRLRLAAFDSAHMMNFMTGSALEATVDTGEAQITDGMRSLVTEIWPYVDGGTVTVQIGTRNGPTESVSWTSAISINALGFAPCRSDARFHRVRTIVAAGGSWNHAKGIKPTISGTSWR
jgi:hypothetical protein